MYYTVYIMNDFVNWLIDEMNKRGWSNSELARRAGVVHSTISMILSGKSNPGNDLCVGIAKALKIPPEEVFRRAGILPPLPAPDNDPTLEEITAYLKRLSSEDRKEVLMYTHFRYQQAKGKPLTGSSEKANNPGNTVPE